MVTGECEVTLFNWVRSAETFFDLVDFQAVFLREDQTVWTISCSCDLFVALTQEIAQYEQRGMK